MSEIIDTEVNVHAIKIVTALVHGGMSRHPARELVKGLSIAAQAKGYRIGLEDGKDDALTSHLDRDAKHKVLAGIAHMSLLDPDPDPVRPKKMDEDA